ncbi:DUF3857 domain-containing protein [Acidithiobacillus sp. IBUN Pt1247-S3]|uniref:DUF3857 domain-containing protein n=1 Tax=Acidithiobacillus sp. IBUN Pt1247-S3 TaxID=3166642 RepID=UPI0034E4572C
MNTPRDFLRVHLHPSRQSGSHPLLATLLFCSMTIPGIAAANTGFHPVNQNISGSPVRLLYNHETVRVKKNGSYRVRQKQVWELRNSNFTSALNPFTLQYSSEMGSLHVVRAWVSTPSGQKIPITAQAIYRRPVAAAAGAPMYSHAQELSIELPKLQRGDRFHLITEKIQHTPYFPGQYSALWQIPSTLSARNYEVRVVAPSALHLRAAVTGPWQLKRQEKGEEEIFTARVTVHHASYPGPATVSERQFDPLFELSSFPSWAAVGQAYWTRAKGKAALTPELRHTAAQISGKQQGWQAQKSLYSWVSKNIRYVGLELGVGGYVPISAQKTLATRYGDCKAHATLLEALFAARGHPLYPVLINWNQVFSLPPLPTPFWFNHAIDYAPERKIFLDSTGEFETPRQLAVGERDKPALITGPHSHLARTPGAEPENNQLRYTAQLTLLPNGTLQGTAQMQARGWWAWMYRETFASLPPASYPRVMTAVLQNQGGGNGSFQPSDPNLLDQPFALRAHWQTPAYTRLGQQLSLVLPAGPYLTPGLGAGTSPTVALAQVVGPQARKHPVTIYLGQIRWQTDLQLPAGYHPLYLPPASRMHNAAGSFSSVIKLHGLVLQAEYRLRLNRVVYNPKQYPALRRLLLADYTAQQAAFLFTRNKG